MTRVLAAMLLIGLAAPVHAGVIVNGTVSDGGGFTFRDGYWYDSAGLSYTRELESYSAPAYNGCSTCYVTKQRYSYTRVILAPPVVTTPTLTYTPGSPAWMNQIGDVLKERDNIAGFLQTVKVIGPGLAIDQGPIPAYGTGFLSHGNYSTGAYNLGSYGANATTLWTYGNNRESYNLSVADAAKVYDQSNLGILFQALGRTTDQAQRLSGQAHDNLTSVTTAAAEANSRAAEIIAKGIAASEALRAARGPNVSQSVTTQSGVQTGATITPAAPSAPPMPPADPGDQSSVTPSPGADLVAFQAIAGARCAKCHSGTEPKGKFNISDFPSLSDADRAVVFERITSSDASTRMPKDAAPLTTAERALFFRVRGTTTASK